MNPIPIYVLNLDKDTDRLAEMEAKLSPNSFTRVAGVYGDDTDFTGQDEIFYPSRYLVPKSALGCAMSHRKAASHLLESGEEYCLILEDDAAPVCGDYMQEVEAAIRDAPADWHMINLDYLPDFGISEYTTYWTLLKTAYILNRRGAEAWLKHQVYYHVDVDLNFYGIRMYNGPTVVFRQIWDAANDSNNRKKTSLNPLFYISELGKFKMVRMGDVEWTGADLILMFLVLLVLIYYAENIVQWVKLDSLRHHSHLVEVGVELGV